VVILVFKRRIKIQKNATKTEKNEAKMRYNATREVSYGGWRDTSKEREWIIIFSGISKPSG
jgi:hypothetical protein